VNGHSDKAVWNPGIWSVLLSDSARPHKTRAARTRALLNIATWELFDYSPYSHDLATSDYRLFQRLNI
jgi:hypothetical protein